MNNNDIKYRREEDGRVVCGDFLVIQLKSGPCKCEAIQPIKPGYTKLTVKDADEDKTIVSTINNSFSKRIRRNHAKGALYDIHVSDIIETVPA